MDTFSSFFLMKDFFYGSCHFSGHIWPSLNEYVGFKKYFQSGKQQESRKMDQKIEEKMSHGFRNRSFEALLTLRMIWYIPTKERVLTPRLWKYLTYFWWWYKSILGVSKKCKSENITFTSQNVIFVRNWDFGFVLDTLQSRNPFLQDRKSPLPWENACMKIQPFNLILGAKIMQKWYGNPGQRKFGKKHFENGKF